MTASALVLVSPAAGADRAHAERTSGVELALRAGWAIPEGQVERDVSMSRLFIGLAPIELGVGFRLHPRWVAGVYAHYGFAVANECEGDCSGKNRRLGLQVHHHFTPGERVDHWLGIAAGYEWLDVDVGGAQLSYRGFEWVSLIFGEEFPLGRRAGLGPVFSLSLGQYTHQDLSIAGLPDQRGAIAERMVHVWVSFGVRASYSP